MIERMNALEKLGMRHFCLLLLTLTMLCACGSPERRSARKRAPRKKGVEVKAPAKTFVKTPLLAKGIIYRIDPARDEENGKTCMLQVSEMVRGKIEIYESKFVVNVLSLRRSFPWVKNSEYEGSEIYLHMKRRQGEIKIVGLSEKADGEVVPLY